MISAAYESLKEAGELAAGGVGDWVRGAALRWTLYAALQSFFDALAALVAELGVRKPPSYAELVVPLLQMNLVSESFASGVARVARVRNRLAHAYGQLPTGEVLRELEWLERELPALLRVALEVAEERGVDPLGGERSSALKVVGAEFPEVAALILFGWRARGDGTEFSDVDLAVLADRELSLVQLERIAEALGLPPDKVDVVDLARAPNELVYKVLRDGRVLYARDPETVDRRRVYQDPRRRGGVQENLLREAFCEAESRVRR